MKKKVVIFTGAGISKESGVDTFRDSVDGLWENHKIEEVCTLDGWRKDREKVLNFYNDRRRQMPSVEPNNAHKALARLEEDFDVTIVTQNVDDLHERGGSTNIIHLHGELTKARSSYLTGNLLKVKLDSIDIGYSDINIGDKCEKYGAQLRPHIVWFGEYPFDINKAYDAFLTADIVIIVGTSLQIGYTLSFFDNLPKGFNVIYIDPNPSHDLDTLDLNIEYVEKSAVEGVTEIVERIINEQN
jgi:NAD-dependent deacetylase